METTTASGATITEIDGGGQDATYIAEHEGTGQRVWIKPATATDRHFGYRYRIETVPGLPNPRRRNLIAKCGTWAEVLEAL